MSRCRCSLPPVKQNLRVFDSHAIVLAARMPRTLTNAANRVCSPACCVQPTHSSETGKAEESVKIKHCVTPADLRVARQTFKSLCVSRLQAAFDVVGTYPATPAALGLPSCTHYRAGPREQAQLALQLCPRRHRHWQLCPLA